MDMSRTSVDASFGPASSSPLAANEAQIRTPVPPSADVVVPENAKKHKVRLVPCIDSTRSLVFFPTDIDLAEGGPSVQIGRFSDHAQQQTREEQNLLGSMSPSSTGVAAASPGVGPSRGASAGRLSEPVTQRQPVILGRTKRCIAFQSKVVSRLHAELWADTQGKVYIRDTRSSSGTFLNRGRLAPAGQMSQAHELHDGDQVQLGMDYQGGTEDIYRAIKIRMEIDRTAPAQSSEYASNTLRELHAARMPAGALKADAAVATMAAAGAGGQSLAECCICLLKVRVFQALFIAPCSHMYHFKCIRPILSLQYPGFSCPLCRTFADLEADLPDDTDDEAEGGAVSVPSATPGELRVNPSFMENVGSSSSSLEDQEFSELPSVSDPSGRAGTPLSAVDYLTPGNTSPV